MTDMLTAALSYAKRGFPVVPLHTPEGAGCSCRQPDCTAVGKHPRTRKGLHDATINEATIRRYWEQWPNANIGILTGAPSDIFVLDVDQRDGTDGEGNLTALAGSGGATPCTLTAITGNGRHLIFQHPGYHVKNSVGQLATGIDIRADGGYIVVPPSLHANGDRYRWQDPQQPIAVPPSWLLARLTVKKEDTMIAAETESNALTYEAKVLIGERNDTLFKLGSALRGQQAKGRDDVMTILLGYNEAMCEPPLDEEEVIRIVQSVCEYPAEMNTDKSGKRLEQCPLYWFPWNTREWFSDQGIMQMKDYQVGWHTQLMTLAWDGAGYLTADHEKLWKLAKAKSAKAFERDCDLVLDAYDEVTVNGKPMLRHRRLADLYVKTVELWMKKKAAGLASKGRRLAREDTDRP